MSDFVDGLLGASVGRRCRCKSWLRERGKHALPRNASASHAQNRRRASHLVTQAWQQMIATWQAFWGGHASETNNSRWNEGDQQQKARSQSPDITTKWPNLASWEIRPVHNGKWAEVGTVGWWEASGRALSAAISWPTTAG